MLVKASTLQPVAQASEQPDAHHNVRQARRQVCMPESTAFSSNAHQLQLLLRVAAAQMQANPTQEEAVLVIWPVSSHCPADICRCRSCACRLNLIIPMLTSAHAYGALCKGHGLVGQESTVK